ncbi:hypothetical protein GCM10027073_20570 [Streptomyces chlorus]
MPPVPPFGGEQRLLWSRKPIPQEGTMSKSGIAAIDTSMDETTEELTGPVVVAVDVEDEE